MDDDSAEAIRCVLRSDSRLIAGNPSCVQVDAPVSLLGYVWIVGHQNGGALFLLSQLEHDVEHFAAGLLVEASGGFVGEQDRGASREGAGQRDSLLLPARELAGIVVSASGESHPLQQLCGPSRG